MVSFLFFFFNDPATTEIYTLSLHDALPILISAAIEAEVALLADEAEKREFLQHLGLEEAGLARVIHAGYQDRKSTRLNSSHMSISYAVFCLKKKTVMKVQYSEHE